MTVPVNEAVERAFLALEDFRSYGHGHRSVGLAIDTLRAALSASNARAEAVEQRTAEMANALATLTDAFINHLGCFPLDAYTPEMKARKDALTEAYRLVGQPNTSDRQRKMSTLATKGDQPHD